jgi:4-amino-4-deoxychorismate lyase
MCRLFETVRIVNGVPQHLLWHEKRMAKARQELWGCVAPLPLEPRIRVPYEFSTGVVRCNIIYGPDVKEVKFQPYIRRIIRSLKLVNCSSIDYHVKYADRSMLESLLALRGSCDEVILVNDGLITDTSMSNLVFFDGTSWITPAVPLLAGTCRNRLVAEEGLPEGDIRPADLGKYTGCKLINAMRDPAEEELIPVSQIFQ